MIIYVLIANVSYANSSCVAHSIDKESSYNYEIRLSEYIALYLEIYKVDNCEYPSREQGLKALIVSPSDKAYPKWRGPYLKGKLENLIRSGVLEYDSDGKTYQLIYLGIDRIRGGQGFDRDSSITPIPDLFGMQPSPWCLEK